jgi:HSP20 family protein
MYALTRNRGNNPHRSRDPFALLARDFFGYAPVTATTQSAAQTRSPRFDFLESPEGYTLRGDLPGVTDDNLEITVHEGILVVKGSFSEQELTEDTNFVLRERQFGDFERRLQLPKDADPARVEAKLANGVLNILIAKKEERKARKIKIG